jgi:pseudolysin
MDTNLNATTLSSSIQQIHGIGYGGNSKIGELIYGKTLPKLTLTRDSELALCFMETDTIKVVDMQHLSQSDNETMRFYCPIVLNVDGGIVWTGYQNDGYDQENGGYSPSNDALYAGNTIKNIYQDWYHVPALSHQDGSPMPLIMRVHYGNGFENAFWDGKQMTFGDGKNMMYPLISLGIAAHEISHGFTEQQSHLIYNAQSGGMNEAFSDMAAQAAEFYTTGTNSWKIGAEVLKETSEFDAVRYMDRPSRDGESIDTADDYYRGMDVHASSGVYNRLFYLIANQPGWDTRKAFDVMVKANMDYWTPYSTFDQGACGILSAAKDLGFEVVGIRAALRQVAVKYGHCK